MVVCKKIVRVGVIPDPGCMRQKVAQGDRLPGFRAIGQVFANAIANFQLAAFLQDHDRHARELLGDRADAKNSLWCVRDVQFDVGFAIAFADDRQTVSSNQDRATELIIFHGFIHVRVNHRSDLFGCTLCWFSLRRLLWSWLLLSLELLSCKPLHGDQTEQHEGQWFDD